MAGTTTTTTKPATTTTTTTWPTDPALSPPPAAVKQWLSDFYETVDSKTDDSGARLAALFTDEGIMYGMSGRFVGKEAIKSSRTDAWKVIASRKHTVSSVFTDSRSFSSILVTGLLDAGLRNGNRVEAEFAARIDFEEGVEEGGGRRARASQYKVWGDSAPWIKVMSS